VALGLASSQIGDAGALALAEGLADHPALQLLDLRQNAALADDGATALGALLARNGTLRTLDLTRCKIGARGGAALAAGLGANGALTHLQLRDNQVGDEGGVAFGAALAANSVLELLNLNDNGIGDAGARALLAGLEENAACDRFDADSNPIVDTELADEIYFTMLMSRMPLKPGQLSPAAAAAIRAAADDPAQASSLNLNGMAAIRDRADADAARQRAGLVA
jgi:hypothetical protein